MRKPLAIILSVFGLGQSTANSAEIKKIDPKSILYSTPTLADEVGELDAVSSVSDSDFVMHEDEWRQLEFYPAARLAELKDALHDLKAFEHQHRKSSGWSDVFIRKLPAAPVILGDNALGDLSKSLEAKPGSGPILFHGSNTISGRVANGFSLNLAPGLLLYGVTDAKGIQILCASVTGGDLALTKAFTTLNAADRLVLVDWRSQMLLTGVASNGDLEVWKP